MSAPQYGLVSIEDLTEQAEEEGNIEFFLELLLMQNVINYESEESEDEKGLGIFPEKIKKFSEFKDRTIKIPHMGWNQVEFSQSHFIWEGLESSKDFYFVHSYASKEIDEKYIYSKTFHGESFNSAVAKDNIFATQFHPEKSGKSGLNLLQNFIDWKI